MSSTIDRTDSLGADRVAGLTHYNLMKSDPVWAQLAGEIAKLQSALVELQTKYNLVLAQLDAGSVAGGPYNVSANQALKPAPHL